MELKSRLIHNDMINIHSIKKIQIFNIFMLKKLVPINIKFV